MVAVPLLVGLSGRKVSWTTWVSAGALHLEFACVLKNLLGVHLSARILVMPVINHQLLATFRRPGWKQCYRPAHHASRVLFCRNDPCAHDDDSAKHASSATPHTARWPLQWRR